MELIDLLKELKGERFVYIPNPGNGGDSLIAAATYQTFDRLCLSYDMPKVAENVLSGRTVVFGGGGNLVSQGSYSYKVVRQLHRDAKRLIVLPHTVKDVAPLLADLGPNVWIVCRERASYDYVKSSGTRANALLGHDMAMSLDTGEILANKAYRQPPSIPEYIGDRYLHQRQTQSLRNLVKSQKVGAIVRGAERLAGSGDLYCFRQDGEKTGNNVPPACNIDLSETLAFGVESRQVALFVAHHVLSFLNRFDRVHTDRLHMSIGSALLGKHVHFYPNNYFKCREVYNFSLRDKFPNVQWMG